MSLDRKRLKRLVRYRERLERRQEGELAAQLRLHARREEALAASEGERESLLDTPSPGRGPLDPALLSCGAAYAVRLERDIAARRSALARSAEDVEAERAELMERSRDRKAMETLLDHRIREERQRRSRADIARLDEQAGIRWLQQQREAPAQEGRHEHRPAR